MKERPILMASGPVRNILAGRQTQDRRPVKRTALQWLAVEKFTPEYVADPENGLCPYGQPGDRLWVRETWRVYSPWDDWKPSEIGESVLKAADYRADSEQHTREKWRPSIHMPRAASRITLEITGVRVERVQEISLGDICKEGLAQSIYDFKPVQRGFDAWKKLWESCYGPGSWDENPWVWVIDFKKLEGK